MKNKEIFNKFKNLYTKYKEAKKDPRKKAGLKLLGYFIFFFIFMLMASIANSMETREKLLTTTTTTTVKVDKYFEKQNKLLEEKYNIEYNIKVDNKEYKINGTLEDNVVTGYLEGLDNIKKIVLKDNNIYEFKDGVESVLEVDFNINYLKLEYIFKYINEASVIKDETGDIKKYNYNITLDEINFNITVTTNDENIVGLELKNDLYIYELNFDK